MVIEDVAVGAEHTLALASTGDVYAWGSNSEGQVNVIFAAFAYSRNLTFICKNIFVFYNSFACARNIVISWSHRSKGRNEGEKTSG